MKKLDSIGRRTRTSRMSEGLNLSITERDLLWFEKLHLHGPLPTSYLIAYAQHLGYLSVLTAKWRIRDLFHEGYLSRPIQQFETMDARYQEIVSDTTEESDDELKKAGKYVPFVRDLSPWKHRFMGACADASIELATLGTDFRFIPQWELWAKELSFPVPGGYLKPDKLFGIEHAGKRFLVFRETDRSTETLRVSKASRKSMEQNILDYREFVGRKGYQKYFGDVPAFVMMHTRTPGRMQNFIDLALELSEGKGIGYMLFRDLPEFAGYLKPPQPMTDLFGAYKRAGRPDFYLNK